MPILNMVYGASTPVAKYKTYTIKWAETSSPASAFIDYEDDASEFTKWAQATYEAMDAFFGFCGKRLSKAWVETWDVDLENMSSQSWLTSGDNVMVKFPIRWIKMTKSGTTVTLSITDNPNAEEEWFTYYAHSRGTISNPVKKDAFYLWVYEASTLTEDGNTVLKSLSNATVTASQTMQTFINQARNTNSVWYNGAEWYDIEGFYQRMYVNALYMMKYANPNSQATIWNGLSSTSKQVSGGSNSMSGSTNGSTANQTSYMKLFGLENRRWNVSEWVGWMCTDWSSNLWTALSGFVWDIKTTSPYENTGTTLSHSWVSSNRTLSSIWWTSKSMFAPTWAVSDANRTTYYCDYANVTASCLALASGSYGSSSDAGAFCLGVTYSASYSYAYIGSRLMFL